MGAVTGPALFSRKRAGGGAWCGCCGASSAVPEGVKGWRAIGDLDLGLIGRLAKEK
jgi:hypothetical protein